MSINTPTYADFMKLVSDAGLGTAGVDLFGGEWGVTISSEDIDAQVMIKEGVGIPSVMKELYEQPSIQVLVRGGEYGSPESADFDVYQKAKSISDYILSMTDPTIINGIGYTGFEESSNIAALGKDEKNRFIYSMNFTCYRNR